MSSSVPTVDSASPSRWEWLIILLGSTILLTHTLQSTPLRSANDRSRWETVWALVHRGSYIIDEIDADRNWRTIDKVRHNGHFFSTKPPLLSTTAAGVYWVVHQSTGLHIARDTVAVTQIVLLVINWLPMTIAFVVMARLLVRASANCFARSLALSTFCFGSLATSYATTLNNHSVATVCLIFSLHYLFRIASQVQRETPDALSDSPGHSSHASKGDFFWAGFWSALVPCNELPAALFGIVAFVLIVWSVRRSDAKSPPRLVALFVVGALIPLIAYFALNVIATGGWKPFYMYYGTEKYRYVHEGIPSYWINPKGLDKSVDSPFIYFLHCTIGHHGIFSLTPVLLLLMISPVVRADSLTSDKTRSGDQSQFPEVAWLFVRIGCGLSIAVLVFYLTRTANYNYGGNTYGLRWMFWLSPFWMLGLIPAFEWCALKSTRLILAGVLLMASIATAQMAAQNPWSESWLFTAMKSAGWIDYSDPPPQFPFKRALHTWFSNLPTGEEGVWIEFKSDGSASDLLGRQPDTIRIKDHGATLRKGKSCREIAWEINFGGNKQSVSMWFDIEAFSKGEPLGKTIVEYESDSEFSWRQLFTLVRGIPTRRAFRPGVTRYVKTDVQSDYFTCQRAATQVVEDWNGRRIRFRSDTWLCPDVPFGAVQFEWTEYDAKTGIQLSLRRFKLSATGSRSLK